MIWNKWQKWSLRPLISWFSWMASFIQILIRETCLSEEIIKPTVLKLSFWTMDCIKRWMMPQESLMQNYGNRSSLKMKHLWNKQQKNYKLVRTINFLPPWSLLENSRIFQAKPKNSRRGSGAQMTLKPEKDSKNMLKINIKK